MSNIKVYLVALVVFSLIDAVWLGFISRGLYQQQIGYLLSPKPNWLAAILFYLVFIAGLVFFVINPALAKTSIMWALGAGAAFGFICYATYDLTNLATVKDWPVLITVIDLAWGSFICAAVSTSTYYLLTTVLK